MRLRARFAIRMAKFCNKWIKKLNRGSGLTLPGKVARMLDPDILSEMASMIGKKIIVTMGTNGKTTTNAILYHAVTALGETAIINRTGSNMMNGIVSAFVLATDKKCRIHADYACIEVDENASKTVLPALKPDCILLTNISRDQLDRFGEVDLTFNTIKQSFASVPNAPLVLNCDDLISYNAALDGKNPYLTYGISEQTFDYTARSEIRESIFCRRCEAKLEYDFFHYGQLGVYHCPKCGFARPVPDYEASGIRDDEKGYSFEIENRRMRVNTRTRYNIYNALAAYSAMKAAGIPTDGFAEALDSFDFGNGREDTFTVGSMKVQLNLAKNPIGFQQKVSYVMQDKTPKDIIILINDDYQDGRDISWLWDVDFQYLADADAASIYTTGSRRYDMALRLKYDEIPCKVTDDLKQTIAYLSEHGTGNLYIIVNYTALYSTNHLLHELEKNVPENTKEPAVDLVTPGDPTLPKTGKKLTIGHLYPDLLNLYGDRGNIQCMKERLAWRGIDSEVIRVNSGERADFSKFDIVLLGGGSDREQEIVCGYLREIREDFIRYIEDGGVVIAVCGGYQLLGEYYKTPDKKIDGIGALDFCTEWKKERLVSDIVLQSSRYKLPVTGFENHGGRTYIGNCEPFGKVLYGFGNTDEKSAEGVVYKNVIATYLHGPLLPKNPEVCDDLLRRALIRKYGEAEEMIPLEDAAEANANRIITERHCKSK